jgi:hypothetical protein
MFSKQEASQLRKEFWTVLGQYLSPILSSEGEKINWINYKTGVKGLQFKMDADREKAFIGIFIIQPDTQKHQELFAQLLQLKNSLHTTLQEEWTWLPPAHEEGKLISKTYKEKTGISILKKEDWPQLISFFKPRIIALDEFWNAVKYDFEGWQ